MILSNKQEIGIQTMSNRYKAGEIITTVGGYAGIREVNDHKLLY